MWTRRARALEGEELSGPVDDIPVFWLIVGFTGQALFSARFLIQWIVSERAKKSLVPTAFWLFSIGGGAVMLIYAIYGLSGIGCLVNAEKLLA